MRTGRRELLRHATWLGLLVAAYPALVLGSTYAYWFAADLPGGRNGPADAYRHSLASATVAYTGSPRWVEWVTAVMEGSGNDNDMNAMDVHNNRLGADIGTRAGSWRDMHEAVRAAVEGGDVLSSRPDQITWLPRERWRDRWY